MSVSSNLICEQENESEYSCLYKSKITAEIENHEEIVQDKQYEDETESREHSIFPTSSTPEESINGDLQDVIAVPTSERNDECQNLQTQINYSGEVTTQVTSDDLHLEIRNVSSSHSRTKVVITNQKSLKKSRSYHDSQHQQSQHNAYNIDAFVDEVNGNGKENTNKQNGKMPLIKVQITGEGIEVKYKTIDRHLTVHIERDNEREEKEARYSNSNDDLQEGSWSSYSSDVSPYQREEIGCPDCCIDIPPPEEFADGRCASPNTNVANEALIHDDLIRESKINNEHNYEEEDFEDLKHNDHIDFTESGFDEEMQDVDNVIETQEYSELQNKCLLIQVTPPSRSASREYILEKNVNIQLPNDCVQTSVSQTTEISQSNSAIHEMSQRKRRGSVVTVVTRDLEQRLLVQGDNQAVSDSISSRGHCELHKDIQRSSFVQRNSVLTPVLDVDSSFEEQSQPTHKDISSQTSQSFDPFLAVENQSNFEDTQEAGQVEKGSDVNFPADDTSPRNSSDSAIPGTSFESIAGQLSSLKKSDSEENGVKRAEKNEISETPKKFGKKASDAKPEFVNKHLRLPKESVLKESRACEIAHEEASDRWAKKRKQFKETKNCNSGGSSVTSNITEESGNSEETRSVDLGVRSDKDKGLYTESFHSISWIFRGDDCSPDNSPRCLSKRPRSVAIRERTVQIAKGTGDYPWGFRIQFSKPILVSEVDTNGAAEEAGLQVGDIVMAVNGTDVTSIPHSEAACLARQGPDLLTLVVGSDISRFPTTPRPSCRGYLHKRTHSGLLKGWRKRWFVLKHDGSLQYYKHKKDEGKCRPLEVTKLEGSEIGVDTSLGKPFVFKCVPQSGNRIFYFCATSNQEMKRWLEAMDKAVHPLTQNHVWVDVTMHNLGLPPLAIKNPECLGLLHQLDRNKDVWMHHYCILKDGCLYFYSSIRSTSALGGIYLQGYTVTEQSVNSRRCIIELRPPSEEFKAFYLSAGNAAENKRWITALKMSINKWLPLHQAIQDFMSRPLEESRM
ncbi:hypothetical protein XELAEV_18008033mg [Xenopus laevis]|uniref:Uncharacterized protein n=1 Tax=Xenopus laevis TaxID=8355 RepID=A0A974I5X8_XENLA|nr:hypothetical protein XELAEV_18008033mg [Xenopus laevis]